MPLNEEQERQNQWVPVSLAPDPVIDAYKPGIDMTLLKQNLTLTVEQRLEKFLALQAFAQELRTAGNRMRASPKQA